MRYQSTTGLNSDQINELVQRMFDIETSRSESSGAGRPRLLSLSRQVVIVLMMLRQNMTQTVMGDLHGISQSTVSRIWRRVLPLLEQVTCMHGIQLTEAVQGRIVLVDGTYIPTGNRGDHETGKANYSGKRHTRCLSVQVAADTSGILLAVSEPVPGARHDAAAIQLTGWDTILQHANWIADSAYLATNALTPARKPPGDQLTKNQLQINHDLSSIRSAVERSIAHLKNWKILATGYRGILNELPNIIRITTRLEFYRLGW